MSRKSLLPPPPPPADYSLVDDIPTFQQLNRDLCQLNSHLIGLQRLHDNFTQFNESIGSLLYGLNINAWCTEFVEAPSSENFANKFKVDQLNVKIAHLKEKINRLEGKEPVSSSSSSSAPVRQKYSTSGGLLSQKQQQHLHQNQYRNQIDNDVSDTSNLALLSEDSFILNPQNTASDPATATAATNFATRTSTHDNSNHNNNERRSTRRSNSPGVQFKRPASILSSMSSTTSSSSSSSSSLPINSKNLNKHKRQSRIPQLTNNNSNPGYRTNRATLLRQKYQRSKLQQNDKR